MVIVYSATKGLAAMTLAVAHSRGWLDYEERVCDYWPEFAQQGKERSPCASCWPTRRDSTRSTSRSIAVSSPTSIASRSCSPARNPRGSRARVRRITASRSGFTRASSAAHRSEASQPRTVLPGRDRHAAGARRLHPVARGHSELPAGHHGHAVAAPVFHGFPLRLALDAINPRSDIFRALRGSELPLDPDRIYARNLELPSAAPSAPHVRSRMHTACSRRAAGSCGSVRRRSRCSRRRRCLPRAGSSTSA